MIANPIASAMPAANSAAGGVANNSSSEQNMFLTLLVAQLKNQDPLAPQDGTQFIAQLAQFNSLDQLIGIRQSIEQLTTLLNQSKAPETS